MKNRDLILSLVAAALTAFFLPPTLQEKGLHLFAGYPTYYIYVIYTILAFVGMFVLSFLGRRLVLLWQLAKFGLVGVLNTAIDFGILNYLSSYLHITEGVQIIPIKATSFLVALANSYWWNKNWVFEGKKKANMFTFAIVSIIGFSVNISVVYLFTSFITHPSTVSDQLWLNIANVLATFLSLTWNFLGYRLIVFKK